MTAVEQHRRAIGCLGVSFAFVMALTVALAVTAALTAIWPGVYELTAPVLCPEGFDDPLVVRDSTQVQPGETTFTFTLYCMNERGEVRDVGVLRPALLVFAGVVALIVVLAGLLALTRPWRRRAAP
ncbi:MAG TPA: hypothetical protein VK866_02960 [Acidimicrobiales bacterium]|nr:hypothetical protein [Acidimicrobiales bacterium]